jgi:uncharacterized RDD family membrane protein YckC
LDPSIEPRAGFWRRASAVLVDIVIVCAPLQVVAIVLFATTSGMVQNSSGIVFRTCVPAKEIPQGLTPPPPANANAATECSARFFGMETARTLTVSRIQREGATTVSVKRNYMLDRSGHVINGYPLDWVVAALFALYVIAFETRRGATIGDRVLGISVFSTQDGTSKPPLRRIVARNLAKLAGFAPMLAVALYYSIIYVCTVLFWLARRKADAAPFKSTSYRTFSTQRFPRFFSRATSGVTIGGLMTIAPHNRRSASPRRPGRLRHLRESAMAPL